jgi:hypothetical protein
MREFLETITVIAVWIMVGAVGIAATAALLFGGVVVLRILMVGVSVCGHCLPGS